MWLDSFNERLFQFRLPVVIQSQLILCSLFFLNFTTATAQSKASGQTITDSLYTGYHNRTDRTDIPIKASQSVSNVLYTGIDNPLSIKKTAYSANELRFSCTNGQVFFDDDEGVFYCIPHHTGRSRISMYGRRINQKDSTLLGFADFLVKSMPQPSIMAGSSVLKDNMVVKKDFLIQNDSLSVFVSNDILQSNQWYKVAEYSFGHLKGGYYKSYLNPGPVLTDVNKEIIQRLRPGTEISIKVKLQGSGSMMISSPIIRLQVF